VRSKTLCFIEESGAPGESRTPDLLVRSQTLYPAELRAHVFIMNGLEHVLKCKVGSTGVQLSRLTPFYRDHIGRPYRKSKPHFRSPLLPVLDILFQLLCISVCNILVGMPDPELL
jgi:hypothetical protein